MKNQSTQAKIKRKKLIINILGCSLLCLLGIILFYFIFRKPHDPKQPQSGYNTNVPQADTKKMYDDKLKAYQVGEINNKNSLKSLQYMTNILNNQDSLKRDSLKYSNRIVSNGAAPDSRNQNQGIGKSYQSYENINKNLHDFYEPKQDHSKVEELEDEINQLKLQLQKNQTAHSVGESDKIMERSYRMAAKYFPQNAQNGKNKMDVIQGTINNPKKTKQPAVQSKVDHIVTSLSNEKIVPSIGFNGINQTETSRNAKNTIRACVNADQTISNGQSVSLRLIDAMRVGSIDIAPQTLLSGMAVLNNERLEITITTLLYNGTILPVNLSVYNTDGIKGLYVPSSMDVDGAKEIIANSGNDLGSGLNIATGGTSQIISDVSRGLIQGVSGLFAKKLRTIQIKLKAGTQVLLLSQNN